MKCDEIRELLSLYIDRMLDEDQEKEVEEHLSLCDACRKEYDELKNMLDFLGQAEMVPVPDSFQLRLKKALKDEKQSMLEEGILTAAKPEKKKKNWRIITSVAAVFAVGILSYSLFDNISGILPGGNGGNEQTGTEKTKETFDLNTSESAVAGNESSDGSVVMKDQADDQQNIADTYGTADTDENEAFGANRKAAADSTDNAAADTDAQAPMYSMAADSAQDTGSDNSASSASSDGDYSAGSGSSESSLKSSIVANSEDECSRSLTVSGIERNAAAVQYYNNLIEEKLSGFDYQILESRYAQTGEWQFRIFIFRGKDGNTYNEEILIIGKDGKIETICPDELMGL